MPNESRNHGDSEKNLRDAFASSERLLPCVLWIDELEMVLAAPATRTVPAD